MFNIPDIQLLAYHGVLPLRAYMGVYQKALTGIAKAFWYTL